MSTFITTFKEGNKEMKQQLGGKGANLAEMTNLGYPVPNGFTIHTSACSLYQRDQKLSDTLKNDIKKHIQTIERETNKNLGSKSNPLLLSIRSGAEISMPGMMDTILNLGINDEIAYELAKKDPLFAYDLYRRFIQMYGNVVKGIPMEKFDKIYDSFDTINTDSLLTIINDYKSLYQAETKETFSQNPYHHLYEAIESVMASWGNERAVYYRDVNNIHNIKGTAVNVQTMVFGNVDEHSATGVCFSRNPSTGKKELFGEILWQAQGEDIVAGTHTPLPIQSLISKKPELYEQLHHLVYELEKHYKDMQDIEFTIESNRLYLLQTRSGKRTPQAALKINRDLFDEGIISKKELILQTNEHDISGALHAEFNIDTVNLATEIGHGMNASPGAAVGRIAFNKEQTLDYVENGYNVILVRHETSPDDIQAMDQAQGIITAQGGMTSHAAVVTRAMGKPCIVGSNDIKINNQNEVIIGQKTYQKGDYISMSGTTGTIYDGKLVLETQQKPKEFDQILNLGNKHQTIKILANADTPKDIKTALLYDAKGIGLVRTEHMFFDEERIRLFQQMILSQTSEKRKIALDKLLPVQAEDFYNLFKANGSLPITVRYLDPPLHEFLPNSPHAIKSLSDDSKISVVDLKKQIQRLQEVNPMMGHRGIRLGITYPEIYTMQTTAILIAALKHYNENPTIQLNINLMLPLVSDLKELIIMRETISKTIKNYESKHQVSFNIKIGTMIELPRACLIADEIAEHSDFISFGTNDLTQMTLGFSRDDIHSFIDDYGQKGIYKNDPFKTIDTDGVGELLKIAVQKARSIKPQLPMGVCGEHGGDRTSIIFFENIGMDYVSCSPYRVPNAILTSAKIGFQ
ncbi:pyruvate, phosphate dikinase [Erysipelothrix urinaevulpis]|uniref:pyruvate, phosphate dikinase n=1 Tax=Erysipelothrix urinaevulpis TaxID=2683717 RepID=UPI001356F5EB|nr:pyruvate, phosphate dikinase [Erysipelothrix urinaevulpis]